MHQRKNINKISKMLLPFSAFSSSDTFSNPKWVSLSDEYSPFACPEAVEVHRVAEQTPRLERFRRRRAATNMVCFDLLILVLVDCSLVLILVLVDCSLVLVECSLVLIECSLVLIVLFGFDCALWFWLCSLVLVVLFGFGLGWESLYGLD